MEPAHELVLGGEGLIGSEVARLLGNEGSEVRSLDLKSGVDIVTCDPAHFDWASRIWFLAWDVGGVKYLNDPSAQHLQYRNNSALMIRVFEEVSAHGTPCLFVTSQLAGQRNAYGSTKLLGELWAESNGAKVARLWNVYGWEVPGIRSHVVTDFTLAALHGGPITCGTDGSERRRLLYKTDCARALIALFDSTSTYADVAGEEWVSVRDLALKISEMHGVEAQFGRNKGEEVMIDPENRAPGWAPSVSLADGLRAVADDAHKYLGGPLDPDSS